MGNWLLTEMQTWPWLARYRLMAAVKFAVLGFFVLLQAMRRNTAVVNIRKDFLKMLSSCARKIDVTLIADEAFSGSIPR